jgi:hypothetical protein
MKKNLITLMVAAAILTSSSAVFADTIPTSEPVDTENAYAQQDAETTVKGDIMLLDDETEISVEEAVANEVISSYISNTAIVSEINDGTIKTITDVTDAENQENVMNFTTNDDTLVIDAVSGEIKTVADIKTDDVITVYTNAYAPALLLLPVQYQADVIVLNSASDDALGFIDVDTYVSNEDVLVNAANTLALNIDENTEVINKDGSAYEGELANKDLAVLYTNSTRSIPALTTPEKVVVLGDNEAALAQIKPAKNETEATPAPEATTAPTEAPDVKVDFTSFKTVTAGDETIENVYSKNDTLFVPLRKIAETLGFTVEWDGENRAVILNGGVYSLKIDENSYVKGKMVPQELSAAPEITNDLTYVPVEYFFEILEAQANVDLDSSNITITNVASTDLSE